MMERTIRKLLTAESLGLALVLVALLIMVYGITFSLRNPDPTYFIVASLSAAWLGLEVGKRNSKLIPATVGLVALGGSGV